jgi:tungstate transport system substrate-binding protein
MKQRNKTFAFGVSLIVVTFLVGISVLSAANCKAVYGKGKIEFRLATGSPGELGLLNALGYSNGTCTGRWKKSN